MGYSITLAVGTILLFFSLKYLKQSVSFIKKMSGRLQRWWS